MKLLLILVLVAVPPALGQTCSEGCSTTSKNCQPEQIHIAFGEKINDITITWSTMNDTSETVVQFGEETANTTATGKGKLFDNGDEHRQWIHNVFLKDLKYNTSYVYKVGSKYGWSDQFSFMTPLAGEQYPVSAIVYGDLGYDGDKSTENIKEDITNKRYDLIIHNGDFAYQLNSDDGRNGDNFMNLIQKIAAYVPYMTSPGNHESASNFSSYKNRFSMPGNTESMYYSFNIGPVHFIAIDTEVHWEYSTTGRIESLHNFIKSDLEEASKKENREKHPWIIMYGHRPMYCSNRQHDDGDRDYCPNGSSDNGSYPYPTRKAIEPLLKEYGVDLVIWAHEHSYERLFPVYDQKVYNGSYDKPYVYPRAPTHIVTGSAGMFAHTDHFISNPQPWSALRNSDYGYCRLVVYNHTHLYLEAVSTDHVEKTLLPKKAKAKKIDEMWLVREKHQPYDI